jgi:AGCS family alanine or glycine:cation symporter
MPLYEYISLLSDKILVIPFIFVLVGSIVLTFKTRFVQILAVPFMWKMLVKSFKRRDQVSEFDEIPAYKALFTAMSTTIGTGNIVGPIIAVGLGGPGALAGFMLATMFGCAATFTEVCYALYFRTKTADGSWAGGPMPYVKEALGAWWANLYAVSGCLLLIAWLSSQSNTVATLLEPMGIAPIVTGIVLATAAIFTLVGGIKRIGSVNAMLVPYMFIFYCGACSWILYQHSANIIPAFTLIFTSLWQPATAAGAAGGLAVYQALRWGLARALQSNEAGVGTATFPHSASSTQNHLQQGVLAMVSVYTNGILCLLSGLVILATGAWLQPGATFDVSMIQAIFASHFPWGGSSLFALCSFLFAFGTILGNGYNGGECFRYVMGRRGTWIYYSAVGIVVFLGSLAEVKLVWTIVDFFILPVVLPHMIALLVLAWKRPDVIRLHHIPERNSTP